MNFSLNEIHALAKKATRGAGYPWGLAEEAAMATCWLCARDLDGSSALARLLEKVDQSEVSTQVCGDSSEVLQADGRALCPITSGAAISDQAATLVAGEIKLGATTEPMMLLPFAAQAAQQIGEPVTVFWSDFTATTDGERVATAGRAATQADRVVVRVGGDIKTSNRLQTRVEPAMEVFESLQRLAQRTYAPATEESRLKGAGAGLSDND